MAGACESNKANSDSGSEMHSLCSASGGARKIIGRHEGFLPMSGDSLGHLDDWERRAAKIGPAIRRAFPISLLDQECLRKMIKTASRPLTPKGGVFTRIYAKIFPFAWIDDELLEFLKLLRDHDWTQIDWNRKWMVIPILPDSAFAYCLPGILYWYMMDADAAYEAIEELIDHSLARIFLTHSTIGCDPYNFNAEQKHLIAEVVRLLRDFTLTDNPQIQKVASDLILHLNGGVVDRVGTETGNGNGNGNGTGPILTN